MRCSHVQRCGSFAGTGIGGGRVLFSTGSMTAF